MMLALAGCHAKDGPARFDLSGAVTYDGKPVARGYITFAPDASKGNGGPGASAEIRDGKYTVMAGRGSIGGPHVITVNGFDGVGYSTNDGPGGCAIPHPIGRPLFTSVEIKADLPKQQPGVYDLAIPKQK